MGNWVSSLPTMSHRCPCEGTICPRRPYWTCFSDMTGTERECIFPCPQDIRCFWFCLNLLAIDLLKCWYEREPFEGIGIFSPIFHIQEAKILDCSLRPCWILPALSLLWLHIDNFLQLGLFCGNAPQTSQDSVCR